MSTSASSLLLPIPLKPGTNPRILRQFKKHLAPLVETSGAELVWDQTPFPKTPGRNFYANVADARNHILKRFLRKRHTDVLWIDADLTAFPADLYERLRAISKTDIVAPMCLIEDTDPPMFYDIAGFREMEKEPMTPHYEPWFFGLGPVLEMLAVGACVVIPAEVHRRWAFEPQHPTDPYNNTDWYTLQENARNAGYRVLCDTTTTVYHAKLPDYGEEWHDGKAWNAANVQDSNESPVTHYAIR